MSDFLRNAPQADGTVQPEAFVAPMMGDAPEPAEEPADEPDRDASDQLKAWIESPNIAEELGEEERGTIAMRVRRDFDIDENSRAEWLDKYKKWLEFAMQVAEEKSYPWPGASNVIYPLITTASINFHARAYPAIIQDKNVARGAVVGSDDGVPAMQNGQPVQGQDGSPVFIKPPGQKQRQADKIGRHMSWQLLSEMKEWEPQTDRLLLVTPIVGTMFRKSYFDPGLQRNVSETVTADNLCVNYHAKSFETAPRKTEIIQLYPWDIESNIRGGIFLREEYGYDEGSGEDEDAPTTFLEQHRRWDLDNDGYAEPYIITIARDSGKLARIVAAYDMDTVTYGADHRVRKVDPVPVYTKYGFIPAPDNCVYDIGFGHLLFPINEAINTTINQLFDAGHLANVGGGFVGSGFSMNSGSVRFQMGEYKSVNTSGGTLRDNVLPLPFPGPHPVLFQLLQFLVEAGREVGAVQDILGGKAPAGANTPATTILAMIEQGLNVFTAILKRILRSMKAELDKLFRLNRLYLQPSSEYQDGAEWKEIRQSDYQSGAGVEPIADPTMLTDMQQLGRAQFLIQFGEDPHFDPIELRTRVLKAAQIDSPEKLLIMKPPPDPAMLALQAKAAVEGAKLHLKAEELQIRGAHEEGDLAIRRGKDKAIEMRELTQAMLNLALAKKADGEADIGWIDVQLRHMQMQIEALNAGTDSSSDNPADAAGDTSSGGGGANAGPIQPLATPPGVPSVPAMDPGLGGSGGGQGPGTVAGGITPAG
jgi:chaperonin GroES